ncbi:Ribosome biogenesis protein NOP53 [Gryllus bimaculatus]|nr:Ribosome biogenesis protein NOP53 [Gryllus bimaculatus]
MTKTDNLSTEERKGRKRVSKKNKIAWRKHCSTKDVDLYLEEVRHEERVGVNFTTVEDDKLFYVDTSLNSEEGVKSKAERKLEAKKKLKGVPKCFEALVPHTSVPDPVIKRNRVRTPEERKHPIKKKIEAYRKANGILTAKERIAANNRRIHKIKKENTPKSCEFTKDLWAEAPPKYPEVDFQWLHPTTRGHVLKHTRQIEKKVPESVINKTSVVPAIEAPHPGVSYNPSYLDHHSLLTGIVEKENKLIKEEKHIDRVTTKLFSAVTERQTHSSWIKEMSQGLPQTKEGPVKEEDDGKEYQAVNLPTKDKKKPRKTRKNIRLAKEELNQRKLKAIEKKKVADIYKLKKIVENVEKDELKSLEKQAQIQKKNELKKFEPKRLAKLKFEEYEEEFSMPFDLSGSLVGVRNLGKKKAFTKRSHKEEQK